MFLSLRFMSLCKSVCFIRGRGQRPPRVCVASYGQCDATCVCVSACFRGLNPMTVPQMSLSKFRASLGYRGLVLGLNVSNFFRAFGYFQWSTCKLTNAELGSCRHTYVTKNCGRQCWPVLDTRFCASIFYFLGVVVDAT